VSTALQNVGGGALGTNRHAFDPRASQTRAPGRGIVALEGGGTNTPTLGGGFGVTRARGNMKGRPR
jgi:hypothetical protein